MFVDRDRNAVEQVAECASDQGLRLTDLSSELSGLSDQGSTNAKGLIVVSF